MAETDWNVAPVMVEHFAQTPPETLYHYTNQTGFLGILRTHELWLSSIHYLNDHQEFMHGVSLFSQRLQQMVGATAKPDVSAHLKSMLEVVLPLLGSRRFRTPRPSYVASWSAVGDDLAQWRAYSGSGTGYAIGVRGEALKKLAAAQQCIFAPCIYDPKDQARWVQEVVEVSLQEMIDDAKNGVQYARAGPTDKLFYRVLRFAPLFKHEAFAAENEWRLIADYMGVEQGPTFAVREGRSTLIPHISFKLDAPQVPIALSDIIVGPSPELDLAVRAAMAALQLHVAGNNNGHFAARGTRIPYRNW